MNGDVVWVLMDKNNSVLEEIRRGLLWCFGILSKHRMKMAILFSPVSWRPQPTITSRTHDAVTSLAIGYKLHLSSSNLELGRDTVEP